MDKNDVKKIKVSQCIEYQHLPTSHIHTQEVLAVDKEYGNHVYIAGIIEDSLFLITWDEIVRVVECDKETIPA